MMAGQWANEQTQDHSTMKKKYEPFNSDNGYELLQNKWV